MYSLSEIKDLLISNNEIGEEDVVSWLGHDNLVLVNGIAIYEPSFCRDRGICKLHIEYKGIYTPNIYSY